MKIKQNSKRVTVWCLLMSLCLGAFGMPGQTAWADGVETDVILRSPVIEAESGNVSWDCVYFGNYWQSKYIPQPENRPEQGEDDVVHEDTDGTKFLVREDKTCYRYEPIKWRVLSVNEDGTDALLMADQDLDAQPYHTEYSDTENSDEIIWENSSVRTWLNEDFMDKAFTDEEKEAVIPTEIENKKSPEYVKEEGEEQEEAPTTDRVYLLSREEVTSRAYGFTDSIKETRTRTVSRTDFAGTGGTIKAEDAYGSYLLRTKSSKSLVDLVDWMDGSIPSEHIGLFLSRVDAVQQLRPVLHLDLTKTDLWRYAGKINQEGAETEPDATPSVPTQAPTAKPGVTMAPGQVYPKNPVVNKSDMSSNTWDCIYFGNYYNTKITPSVLAEAGEHDSVKENEQGEGYLVRHEQGYFQYEPIKWRVLSINEDGTDAFLMADEALDVAQFYNENDVEITWEKSDIRSWLNQDFMQTAFTEEEQSAVKTTDVTTADNPWSNEPGGNDTEDKIYLPSIEEMRNPDYGFSSDAEEENTRKFRVTDYAEKGGTPYEPYAGFMPCWLRSPGVSKGCPAIVGDWGNGNIPTDLSDTVSVIKSAEYVGVRPVIHVDLSNTALWNYAGQVTPDGVVVPKKEEPAPTPTPDNSISQITKPTPTPDNSVSPTKKPDVTTSTKAKKPGKPTIKKLKSKKGKKVTVTLSKKVSGAAGYQVAYATKSSMKGKKYKSFKGTSVTVKGLKKKKTYYFRVRAYVKKNGKKVYGSWGNKKRIKVNK